MMGVGIARCHLCFLQMVWYFFQLLSHYIHPVMEWVTAEYELAWIRVNFLNFEAITRKRRNSFQQSVCVCDVCGGVHFSLKYKSSSVLSSCLPVIKRLHWRMIVEKSAVSVTPSSRRCNASISRAWFYHHSHGRVFADGKSIIWLRELQNAIHVQLH